MVFYSEHKRVKKAWICIVKIKIIKVFKCYTKHCFRIPWLDLFLSPWVRNSRQLNNLKVNLKHSTFKILNIDVPRIDRSIGIWLIFGTKFFLENCQYVLEDYWIFILADKPIVRNSNDVHQILREWLDSEFSWQYICERTPCCRRELVRDMCHQLAALVTEDHIDRALRIITSSAHHIQTAPAPPASSRSCLHYIWHPLEKCRLGENSKQPNINPFNRNVQM